MPRFGFGMPFEYSTAQPFENQSFKIAAMIRTKPMAIALGRPFKNLTFCFQLAAILFCFHMVRLNKLWLLYCQMARLNYWESGRVPKGDGLISFVTLTEGQKLYFLFAGCVNLSFAHVEGESLLVSNTCYEWNNMNGTTSVPKSVRR